MNENAEEAEEEVDQEMDPNQEEQEEVKPEPSYATISTTELCVRINSLMYCLNNINSLSSRLASELNTEAYVDPLAPEYDPTDRAAADDGRDGFPGRRCRGEAEARPDTSRSINYAPHAPQ
mgnify:CR=1 FL=1